MFITKKIIANSQLLKNVKCIIQSQKISGILHGIASICYNEILNDSGFSLYPVLRTFCYKQIELLYFKRLPICTIKKISNVTN